MIPPGFDRITGQTGSCLAALAALHPVHPVSLILKFREGGENFRFFVGTLGCRDRMGGGTRYRLWSYLVEIFRDLFYARQFKDRITGHQLEKG